MIEIDLDEWPYLTDTQKTFMGYVAAHTFVEIPRTASASYAIGTYKVADEVQDLLVSRVVFKMSLVDKDPADAEILFEGAHKEPIVSVSLGPDELPELQEGEIKWDPFWVNVGNCDEGYDERDEPVQTYLDRLRDIENAGHLILIETDPEDHVPGAP